MTNVDLARWQFAFTSINHFLFVPITIGLAFLTALLQTAWYRSKRDEYLRLTRFFGTLLVINVAIGVVTGLVQEFQFGMNWSAYSRLVGNIFGAPLAMEGLAAFFLESTFLGLWCFGGDKRPRLSKFARQQIDLYSGPAGSQRVHRRSGPAAPGCSAEHVCRGSRTVLAVVSEMVRADTAYGAVIRPVPVGRRRLAGVGRFRYAASVAVPQGRTRAASSACSFNWVSSSSVPGRDPATRPTPAYIEAWSPLTSADLSPMAQLPSPRASIQPTGPAYRPRSKPSTSPM